MDPKPQPNHAIYLQVIRNMTPEQRLKKAFELTEMTRRVFKQGLRDRFPERSEAEIHQIFLQRLDLCHNRNY